MKAPAMPARRPASAPSPGVMVVSWFCCSTYAATAPPLTIHRQQQRFPAEMRGSADRAPITAPPMSAGCNRPALVVVLTAKVGNELFALQVPQRVLQLHQLDEEIVLRIQPGGVHRALEIEGQPLLDAVHACALGEVHEERHVEHD